MTNGTEIIKRVGGYYIISKETPSCHESWAFFVALILLIFALITSIWYLVGFYLIHTVSFELAIIPLFAFIGFFIPLLYTGAGVTLILTDPSHPNAILRSREYKFSESTENDVKKIQDIVDNFTDVANQRIKDRSLMEKRRKQLADIEEEKKQKVEIDKEILKKQYKQRMEMLKK